MAKLAATRAQAESILDEAVARAVERGDPVIFMLRKQVEFDRMMADRSFVGIRRVTWRRSHGEEDIQTRR